jgi:hypothetical protein
MRPLIITRCPARPYRFEPPFSGEAHALLIFVAASDVSPDEQAEISEGIVASGCRYAVCYGHRCSSWDDSIDLASITAGKEGPDFVMTTWHEKDSPEEVVHFFWWNTSFDAFAAERMGIFVLGCHPEIESQIEHEVARFNNGKAGRVATDNAEAF